MDLLTQQETDEEKIYRWNQTQKSFQNHLTLDEIFQTQVQKTPSQIALQDASYTLNYHQLDILSNQLAHHILQHSANNQIIGICLERSIDTVISILAILKTGNAYVPIDPKIPQERLDYILELTNCQTIIYHQKLNSLFNKKDIRKIAFDQNPFIKEATHTPQKKHQPQDLAYVLFTSGTTGLPKGVAITHQGIVNRLEWMQNEYQLNTQDIVLQKTPYTFDVSVWELLLAHQVGASVFVPAPHAHQSPQELYEIIEKHQISVIHFVPSMLHAFNQFCFEKNLNIPRSLRYVFCSGEALFPSQVNAFYNLCQHPLEVHNLYGPTEASVDVTYSHCPKDCTKIYIGRPIQNIQIQILNEQQMPCKIGEIGELYIAGVGLAKEYIQQPKLTQERFIYINHERLYKTGDLAAWAEHGEIEYFGRNDSQIKIRGYRVELGEIEQVLAKYPRIQQTAVLNVPTKNQSILVAYYESKKEIPQQKIITFLKKYLPEYMIPAGYLCVEKFPLNDNGKLCRKTLQQMDIPLNGSKKLAKNQTQEQLITIWKKALHLEEVFVDEDFFLLGGNSLSAANIVADIQEAFQKKINIADIYQCPTIELVEKKLKKIKISNARTYSKKKWMDKIQLPLTDFQILLWFSSLFEPKAKKMNIVTRKRLKGHLDIEHFKLALSRVIERQHALHYDISTWIPAQQFIQKNPISPHNFEYFDISKFSKARNEIHLNESMLALNEFNDWSKKHAKVKARVFRLDDNELEIQLCMSHLICDETSMRILWDELSGFYLNQKLDDLQSSFKEYVIEEQYEHHQEFNKKTKFWNEYLKEATLFQFPSSHVIKNMKKSKLSYSQYFEIPEQYIENLKAFSIKNHVNLNTVLCAMLGISLKEYIPEENQAKPLINVIKSTRYHHKFDNVLGCMIRVDPIVIDLKGSYSLEDISQQVQDEMGKMHSLQAYSSIMKFAFHSNCFKIKKLISTSIIKVGLPLYTAVLKLAKIPYLNPEVFNFCWRLAAFDRKKVYIVNLNMWNNFLQPAENQNDYFGMSAAKHDMVPYELTRIDSLLDVCFIRDHSNHKPYLVLSGNLAQEIKNKINKDILEMCKGLK